MIRRRGERGGGWEGRQWLVLAAFDLELGGLWSPMERGRAKSLMKAEGGSFAAVMVSIGLKVRLMLWVKVMVSRGENVGEGGSALSPFVLLGPLW